MRTPLERKAYKKAWYAANHERIRAKQAAYRAEHPEEGRARKKEEYVRCRSQYLARARKQREKIAADPEREKAQQQYMQQYYAANQTKLLTRQKRAQLKYNFGMTPEDYDIMLRAQEFKCAICGSGNPGRKNTKMFCVDHCHETGRVRGLLCAKCNSGIGLLRDCSNTLRAAADYLDNSRS